MNREFYSDPVRYLDSNEQLNNARIIARYFTQQGWTRNAIAGMLGNMQTESTFNPAIWQGRTIPSDPFTTEKGYGLTQWTPARKYINWAISQGLEYESGYSQMARIVYEQQNDLQWSLDNFLHMTWAEFIVSEESPEDLARVFLWAYEIPADPDVEQRQEQARYWYENAFTGWLDVPVWLLFKIKERSRK